MKILFLTPQVPYPPQQGTTIRNYNIMRVLAKRHQLDLLSFGTQEQLNGSPLNDICGEIKVVEPPTRSLARRAFETFFSTLPDMARRLHSPVFNAALGATLAAGGHNVIQIEGIEMAGAWLRVAGSRADGSKVHDESTRSSLMLSDSKPATVVFDDHNAEYVLQRSAYESDRGRPSRFHAAAYSFIQWHKLAPFERQVCLHAGNVAAVSDQDAQNLAALDHRIKPTVIPNGVDLETFVPSDQVCAKPLAEVSAVFTGKMDFRPNVDAALWFADAILPVLRQEIPLAHVSFVGQRPSPAVQSLGTRPGVQVTGWVADTRPYISDASVYVVPLRMGGGTRLKVLEAMAMGKAIVSTKLGVEGIACEPGRDLVVADDARDFAQAVCMLMRDAGRRKELGESARRLAERAYDWQKIVPKFDAIYDSAA